MEKDLAGVVVDGAMQALALHGREQGLDTEALVARLPVLRAIIKAEWPAMMETLTAAQNMGEPMLRHLLNVHLNEWAVRALA